jgi:hypothetical protein
MKLKRFSDVETNYIVSQYLPTKIKYKLFNGQVIIDLKKIIDGILEEQGISTYKTDKIELAIPFNADNEVTGNSMSILIDKRRFTLRLKNMEIIPSKQQKIAYDNTHPHRWNNEEWIKFIESLFYEYYGFKSVEMDLERRHSQFKRGKMYGLIKKLKDIILESKDFDTDYNSIIEYLKWVFTNKSEKTSLTLGLICSEAMITNWFTEKKREKKSDGKKRKWD